MRARQYTPGGGNEEAVMALFFGQADCFIKADALECAALLGA
jgi:hypothetical protein